VERMLFEMSSLLRNLYSWWCHLCQLQWLMFMLWKVTLTIH